MQMSLKKDFAEVDRLLESIRRFAADNNIGESDAFSLSIISEELFTNTIKYNRGNRDDVCLTFRRDKSLVVVQVQDRETESFDITKAPHIDPSIILKRGTPGLLGLHLVRQMSSDITFEHVDGVSTITVTRRLENNHA
jgi:anti-sigma regulatory factor (Ser/Thr protein kinase)